MFGFLGRLFIRRRLEIEVDFTKLRLVRPAFALYKSFRDGVREHKRCCTEDFGYPKVSTRRKFRRYTEELEDLRIGLGLAIGRVPSSAFWLTDGKHYLGSGDVRHRVNKSLKTFGGHIGYSIRPAVQNKGLGTIQLKLLLREAKKLGIQTARITCFDENAASARIIEKCGGVLVDKVYNEIRGEQRLTRLYDVNTDDI